MISEAVYISPQTIAHSHAPGIWLPEQVEGWKKVTDAVHAKGGFISCQLWHVGRHAHESFSEHPLVKSAGLSTGWSASAVRMEGMGLDYAGNYVPHSVPKAFTLEMIDQLRQDYITAAKNAIAAGFDFVEIHGAHGYLLQQFFSVPSNSRDDIYGGSLENRFRLLDQVLADVIGAVGKSRVGIRISPHNSDELSFNCPDENPTETFNKCISVIDAHAPAYVLFSEPRWNPHARTDVTTDKYLSFPAENGIKYASQLKNTIAFGAGGFTPISGKECIETGIYPVIAFGRWFISNPDIAFRLQHGFPLNRYVRETFYRTPGFTDEVASVGYTDYPTFPEVLSTLGYTLEQARDPKTLQEIIEKSQSLPYPLIDVVTLGSATTLSSVSTN